MAEIPKIVERRMRAVARHGEHPDPDLLSAFTEKSLGNREQAEVLEHLYACTDCREVVSLASIPPGVPEVVSTSPANPGWFSWPVLRWGAAVACVIVVGTVVTLHQQTGNREAAVLTEPSVHSAQPAAAPSLASSASRPSSATMSNAGKVKSSGLAGRNSGVAASNTVEMAYAKTGSPFNDMVPGRAKEAPAESQVDRAISGTGFAGAQDMTAVAPGEDFALESPTPRWTLNADGTLQRSLDSGRSWQTIPVSTRTTFRALAATGWEIWVGGSGGALYHSSDAGERWVKVQPVVDDEVLADDIIGVEFTDTLHGKLTTSNDETWTTSDSGKTWQRR